jgi:BirA family biotin operon repressor/biotin-[acetyl-CoA-carboxylase] ligase
MTDTNQFADLCEPLIVAQLSAELRSLTVVHLHESIDSTNSFLLQSDHGAGVEICAAEIQTRGRGRRGHAWHTPVRGVTFSLKLTVPVPLAEISGASLVCGVSLCEVLHSFGVSTATVKWPNDILAGHAKLAGILVEVAGHSQGDTTLVVGIGVNYVAGDERISIEREIVDLNQLCNGSPPERSKLIGAICSRVYTDLMTSLPLNTSFVGKWNHYDALAGQEVTVVQQAAQHEFVSHTGTGLGIDGKGLLQLETVDGIRSFSSAEVTIKKPGAV